MHGNARLTEQQVSEIRRLDEEGHLYQTEIAKIFGVHPTTVNQIISGRKRKRNPSKLEQ
jgi:plasmid maintenance system antidote protein VapI